MAISFGPCLIATTAIWLFQDQLQTSFVHYWGMAGRFWLLGLGTPITITASGVPVYLQSLIPLSITLLVLWRAFAGGRRFNDAAWAWPAWFVFAAASLVLVWAIAASSSAAASSVQVVRACVGGTVLMTVPFIVGTMWGRQAAGMERAGLDRLVDRVQKAVGSTPRIQIISISRAVGATSLGLLIGGSAVLSIAIFTHWMPIVVLYEQLHINPLGILVVTALQLAYLPTALVWAIAWMSGAGFGFGIGSTVSMFGSTVAPLPSIPLLAAIPRGGWWQALSLLLPILAGALGGVIARRGYDLIEPDTSDWRVSVSRICSGLIIGMVAGIAAAFCAHFARGSIGPGRLVDVGPSASSVWFWVTMTVGVPAAIVLAWPRRLWAGALAWWQGITIFDRWRRHP